MSGRNALVHFGKLPVPGRVKTRLIPPLDANEAAELYTAFLLDGVESSLRYSSWRTVVAVADQSDLAAMDALLQQNLLKNQTHRDSTPDKPLPGLPFDLIAQPPGDLGARLHTVIMNLLDTGYTAVCIVGTDHPTLPANYIVEAFQRLKRQAYDVVIGPAMDGGYYLIGANTANEQLFTSMPWSSDRLFSETLKRAAVESLNVYQLPEWYDVDDEESLVRAYHDLKGQARDSRTFRLLSGRSLHSLHDIFSSND